MQEGGEPFLQQLLPPEQRSHHALLLALWADAKEDEILSSELCLRHKNGATAWRLVREKGYGSSKCPAPFSGRRTWAAAPARAADRTS